MPFGRSVTWGGRNDHYSDNIRFELEYMASPPARLEVTFTVPESAQPDVAAQNLAVAWNAQSKVQAQAQPGDTKVTFGTNGLTVLGIWVRTSLEYEIRELDPVDPTLPAPTLLDNGLTIKNTP